MLAASDAAAIRVTFVTAWSGVDKTTTGDFLGEYCGARHLDGDDDMRRPSVPECKAATAGLIEAFSDFWFKEKAAPVALWHPYYEMLVNRVQVACAEAVRKATRTLSSRFLCTAAKYATSCASGCRLRAHLLTS